MFTERTALLVSTIAALALGLLALAVALRTGSAAVLLDGVFNLCFFLPALATLRVAKLLQRPDDARYPFGYVQFEPLINMAKGLLILGVGLLALIDAGFSVYRGGHELSAGLALGYAAFAVLYCGALLLYLRRAARGLTSPLVDGDVENWTVNLAISVGMLAAFCLALLFQRAGMATAARLIDPILVAMVVLLTAFVPIRMVGRALLALLGRSADAAVVASVSELVHGALGDLPAREVHVRVLQPGRASYALVHVLLGPVGETLDVRRADMLRRAVVAAVVERHAPAIVDIVFTAVAEFAAPTTGFAIDSRRRE